MSDKRNAWIFHWPHHSECTQQLLQDWARLNCTYIAYICERSCLKGYMWHTKGLVTVEKQRLEKQGGKLDGIHMQTQHSSMDECFAVLKKAKTQGLETYEWGERPSDSQYDKQAPKKRQSQKIDFDCSVNNNAVRNMHLHIEASMSVYENLEQMLSDTCTDYTFHYTATRFECNLTVKAKTRPSSLSHHFSKKLGVTCTAFVGHKQLQKTKCIKGPWSKQHTRYDSASWAPWQKQVIEDLQQPNTADGNICPIMAIITMDSLPPEDKFIKMLCTNYNFNAHYSKTLKDIKEVFIKDKRDYSGYVFMLDKVLVPSDCDFMEQVKRGCVHPDSVSQETRTLPQPYVLCMCRHVSPSAMSSEMEWKTINLTVNNNSVVNINNMNNTNSPNPVVNFNLQS